MRAPSPISALPPILFRFEASPKAISERTSYLRVRLAFHPYPHLIPAFFNIRGLDRKSTRLNSSHVAISYAVFCLKKKKKIKSNSYYHTTKITKKKITEKNY